LTGGAWIRRKPEGIPVARFLKIPVQKYLRISKAFRKRQDSQRKKKDDTVTRRNRAKPESGHLRSGAA
jgi:hypothetical protein